MTRLQEIAVRGQIDAKLSAIFSDDFDREEVKEEIADEVITDIDETADWSRIESDEVVMDDINISLARVLKSKILGQ